MAGDLEYLSVDDIHTLHETIVRADDSTESGVSAPGDIEYTVTTVKEGHFGEGPETIHEKAAELLRLLTANHPFVDGNKRTALVSTVAFYAVNGHALDYGNEIRSLLKRLATDESSVPAEEIVEYLESNTSELPSDRRTKYHEYFSVASSRSPRRNDYTGEEDT
jgi:death-on-curing protein